MRFADRPPVRRHGVRMDSSVQAASLVSELKGLFARAKMPTSPALAARILELIGERPGGPDPVLR